MLTAEAAQAYHATQIGTFADTAADTVTAITMTYAEEAIGVTRAGRGRPAFGDLVHSGDRRPAAERPAAWRRDRADRQRDRLEPELLHDHCAHPTHFAAVLERGGVWRERIRGLRANASTRSHAELDEAQELDEGDPADLGARYGQLRKRLPRLNVLGGCCGTDHRHVRQIRDSCLG